MKIFSSKSYSLKAHPASALLLSMLLSALLMTSGTVIAFFLMSDVSSVRTVTAGVQARYAAEGMNELGLHQIQANLPGYSPQIERTFSSGEVSSVSIQGQGQLLPCKSSLESVSDLNDWLPIAPNASLQVPLFSQIDSEGGQAKVQDFYVEFFVGDSEGNPIFLEEDVLRWRILGQKGDLTQAISEFIPTEFSRSSRELPSIFGSSIPPERAMSSAYTRAKFSERVGRGSVFHPAYPISEFLRQHELSYLTMTNVVQSQNTATIFVRVHSKDAPLPCSLISLDARADVPFGSATSLLETSLRQGENLPVFDFVLYHTD